ncbi:MAG TPA: UDP-N-acetylmuramate dehydrogenase [Burkholderiaceae bacterium]|nr:UDP-N-acetylmuramate dehydrogenase [Burkholderiaceae bacterium]
MSVIIERNVSLAPFNTFGVDVRATHFARVRGEDELAEAVNTPQLREMPRLVLGGGSNILFTGDFEGLVLKIEIPGYERLGVLTGRHHVRVGGGENWHETVVRLLGDGLAGVENLALIPGAVGAAPIQNIGAYGIELAERFGFLEAVDLLNGSRVGFDAAACGFGYRDSVFKAQAGRYVIVALTLALPVDWRPVTGYADVENELRQRRVLRPTARDVFDAVVAIRRRKLPDPTHVGNAGSFFKNPVVTRQLRNELIAHHPSMVSHDIGGGRYKLAAGWLIEACGLKGYVRGRAAVFERQALVLVNRGGATGAELLQLAHEVQDRVRQKFGIALEPEPLIV